MKSLKLTTPPGIALFPHLNSPDTKWNPDGEYKTSLILDPKDEQVEAFFKKLDEYVDAAYDELCLDKGTVNKDTRQVEPADLKRSDLPWKEHLDHKTKEPTGMMIIATKMKALVKPKKGDPFTQKPRLFDSRNKPVTEQVRGGSTLVLAIEAVPYYTDQIGAGVTLRLKAVQVRELQGHGNAESYGFEVDEDGYEAPSDAADEPSQEPVEAATGEDALDGNY